jgi:uncharacterized membrane protein
MSRGYAVAAATTVAAMVATPLARPGGSTRRMLSSVVVTSLFTATSVRAAQRWGTRRAITAAGSIAVATAAVERIGTHTGVPFGRYGYTDALRPQLAGVPAIVPLAWFAMAVPARETAHAALGHRSTATGRVVLGSAALTAWDFFLDPQMVGEGYWRWARRGAYRDIPVSNFVGWFVTGLGVMAALEKMLPVDDPDLRPDHVLVGQYTYMGVMETLGFAAFFRDRTVAAVGGAAMLPVAAAAVRRLWIWRHRR